MMVNMYLIILLIWLHWFCDFFLQTDKMAISKSSSTAWLTVHVLFYIAPFMIIFGPMYGIVNFVLHWIIDFFSSKAATKLWKMEARHWFFVVIGIDQALHYTCLLLTIPLMGWGWGL